MKNRLFQLILLALAAAVIWGGLTGYHRIDESSMGIVEDVKSGAVIKLFHAKRNFIWQGALPWIYHVRTVSRIFAVNLDISVSIPPITDIAEDRYRVKVPLSIKLRIDPAALSNIQLMSASGEKMTSMIIDEASRAYRSEYSALLEGGYRREILIARAEETKTKIQDTLSRRFRGMGFELSEFIENRAYYPAFDIYNEGIKFQNEFRTVKMAGDREMLSLKSRLDRDKIENEAKFSYLGVISRMIKENPELLKYIYIDKMGGDVKVVISSDKELVPGFLKPEEPKPAKKKEIDNLR